MIASVEQLSGVRGCMTSLSISRQIYLAVGCALALLAVLAGLSYIATSKLATTFTGYKATAHQTMVANDLLEEVFTAQLAAFSYRVTPSEKQAEAVQKRLSEIAESLAEAEHKLAGNDAALELMARISQSTQGYRDAFTRMTAFTTRSDRVVANLSSIGSSIRAKLEKITAFAFENGDTWLGHDVGTAQQKFMRGRFYHERFLLTNELQTFRTSVSFLIAARSRMNSVYPKIYDPAMQKAARGAIGQISAYIDAVEDNRDLIVIRNSVRNRELDALGGQARADLEELLDSAAHRQRAMGVSGTASAETTLFFVVLISFIALCIGGALGVIVARSISGGVRDMAGTMSELADGNLDVAVTGTEQRHELGMMARALEVFKGHAQNLQRSLDKERELSGLQRQFVAMVSHEFRTPLAIIDGNAQRLRRRPEKLSADRVLKVAGAIRTSVLRLTDLMESVLAAARMEGGQIKFEPEAFDIRDMVADTCRSYADINTRHVIKADLGALPESYRGDVKLLRQVISNLVSNAVKYSPEGTTVRVQGRKAANGDLVIAVVDRGVGIPKDEVERLFERFFRASTSTGIPGSGIGLHLVKQLVDLHQGRMDVRSTVGEGTTFEVVLPATGPSGEQRDQVPLASEAA